MPGWEEPVGWAFFLRLAGLPEGLSDWLRGWAERRLALEEEERRGLTGVTVACGHESSTPQ